MLCILCFKIGKVLQETIKTKLSFKMLQVLKGQCLEAWKPQRFQAHQRVAPRPSVGSANHPNGCTESLPEDRNLFELDWILNQTLSMIKHSIVSIESNMQT